MRFPGVVSLTVTAQVYVPSLFCEQLLEVGSKLSGVTCITGGGGGEGDGVGIGVGDGVGDGVGEKVGDGDGVGNNVGEGEGGIDVGDGGNVCEGDGDGEGDGVGVLSASSVNVTGMVTFPPFE